MFTIKHIHAFGEENVFPARSVRFAPGTPASPDYSGAPPTLWTRTDTSVDEVPSTGGTIFVMNEAGKTVARYDLGASPVPIVGDGLSDPRPKGLVGDTAALAAYPPHPEVGSFSQT